MTANAFEEDKREAYRSGMNGHLAKPINVREVMKMLGWILK
jgi:CheY-like chemotaxis protein